MSEPGRPQKNAGSSIWPRTDWHGLTEAIGDPNRESGRLNSLLLLYAEPLKVFLLSAFPDHSRAAEEILQDFMQDRMVQTGWLAKARPERGRFRQFLKSSLRNFVIDRLRRAKTEPQQVAIENVQLTQEAPFDERAFDLHWARTVITETLKRMEIDCTQPGPDQPRRSHIWQLFQRRVVNPALAGDTPIPYEAAVQQMGLRSACDAQNMLVTAKRIFNRHLAAVVSEYEEEDSSVRAEILELKSFLARLAK